MTTPVTPDPNGTTVILNVADSDEPNAAGHLPLFQPIANALAVSKEFALIEISGSGVVSVGRFTLTVSNQRGGFLTASDTLFIPNSGEYEISSSMACQSTLTSNPTRITVAVREITAGSEDEILKMEGQRYSSDQNDVEYISATPTVVSLSSGDAIEVISSMASGTLNASTISPNRVRNRLLLRRIS